MTYLPQNRRVVDDLKHAAAMRRAAVGRGDGSGEPTKVVSKNILPKKDSRRRGRPLSTLTSRRGSEGRRQTQEVEFENPGSAQDTRRELVTKDVESALAEPEAVDDTYRGFDRQWNGDRMMVRLALGEYGLADIIQNMFMNIEPPQGAVTAAEQTERMTAAMAGAFLADLTFADSADVKLWESHEGVGLPVALSPKEYKVILDIFARAILAEDCRVKAPFPPRAQRAMQEIRMEDFADTARALRVVYRDSVPAQTDGGLTSETDFAGKVLSEDEVEELRMAAREILSPEVVNAMHVLDFIPGMTQGMQASLSDGGNWEELMRTRSSRISRAAETVLAKRSVFFMALLDESSPDLFIVKAALEALLLRCNHFKTPSDQMHVDIISKALVKFKASLNNYLKEPYLVRNGKAEREFMREGAVMQYDQDGRPTGMTARARLTRVGLQGCLGEAPEVVETATGQQYRTTVRVADYARNMRFEELIATALTTIQRHSMGQLMCPADGSPGMVGIHRDKLPSAIRRLCCELLGFEIEDLQLSEMVQRLLQVPECVEGGIPVISVAHEVFNAIESTGIYLHLTEQGYPYPALTHMAMSLLVPRLQALAMFSPEVQEELIALAATDPTMMDIVGWINLTDMAMRTQNPDQMLPELASEELQLPTPDEVFESIRSQFIGQEGNARKLIDWLISLRDSRMAQCGHPLFDPGRRTTIDEKRAACVFGDTGTGKTTGIEIIANACGFRTVRISVGEQSPTGFVGKQVPMFLCEAAEKLQDKYGVLFEQAVRWLETGEALIIATDSHKLWTPQDTKSPHGQAEGWNAEPLRQQWFGPLDPAGGHISDLQKQVPGSMGGVHKVGTMDCSGLIVIMDASLSDQRSALMASQALTTRTYGRVSRPFAIDTPQDLMIMAGGVGADFLARLTGAVVTMKHVTQSAVRDAYYNQDGLRACRAAFVNQMMATYKMKLTFTPQADELIIKAASDPKGMSLFGFRQMIDIFAYIKRTLMNVFGRLSDRNILISAQVVKASLLYGENAQLFTRAVDKSKEGLQDGEVPDPQVVIDYLTRAYDHLHVEAMSGASVPSFLR